MAFYVAGKSVTIFVCVYCLKTSCWLSLTFFWTLVHICSVKQGMQFFQSQLGKCDLGSCLTSPRYVPCCFFHRSLSHDVALSLFTSCISLSRGRQFLGWSEGWKFCFLYTPEWFPFTLWERSVYRFRPLRSISVPSAECQLTCRRMLGWISKLKRYPCWLGRSAQGIMGCASQVENRPLFFVP